ncbi:MAG: hypothetical protein J6A25_02880 [Lachnospiraceae bacterium]|nr:hypothetical protein [Lachnospiraceae bacterium]
MSKRYAGGCWNDFYEYGSYSTPRLYDFKDKEMNVRRYVNYMLSRTQQMFKYENLPETLPQLFLEKYLQRNGYCGIAKINGNIYALFGGIGGMPNEYYFPTKFIVANPYLNFSGEFTIDKDCVIMRNDSEMQGLLPLCNRYASLMVESDITMRIENINRRIPAIAVTQKDSQKTGLDVMMKRIEDGDMSIGLQEGFDENLRTMPYSATANQITDLIEFHQYCKGAWFQDLGLRASFNMKREAISGDETSMNDDMMLPLVDNMLRCRKDGVEKINKMFGTDISVDFDSVWLDMMETRDTEQEILEKEAEVSNQVNSSEQKEIEDEVSED